MPLSLYAGNKIILLVLEQFTYR